MTGSPLLDRLDSELWQRHEFDAQGVAELVERTRRHTRDLVLRASADLGAGSLAAQIGGVELKLADKSVLAWLNLRCSPRSPPANSPDEPG